MSNQSRDIFLTLETRIRGRTRRHRVLRHGTGLAVGLADARGRLGSRVHGGDGTHDHRVGAARDPHRAVGYHSGRALVGGERLLDRGGRAAAALGLAGRPLRPATDLPPRTGDLRTGVDSRGRLQQHRHAHRGASPAGGGRIDAVPRRTRPAAHRLPSRAPPDGHRNLGRHGWAGRSSGADPGGPADRCLRLAGRVLRECARGGGVAAAGSPHPPREPGRSHPGQGRHDRSAIGVVRGGGHHPRDRAGRGLGMGQPVHPRRVLSRSSHDRGLRGSQPPASGPPCSTWG